MPNARSNDGRLEALNASLDLACAGFSNAGIRISGTFSGTVTFQGSVDGKSYSTLTVTAFDGATTATTTTAVGQWRVNCSGLLVVRCAMTSYVSGAAVAFLLASSN